MGSDLLSTISRSRKASLNALGILASLLVCIASILGLCESVALATIGTIGLLCAGNTTLQGIIDKTSAKK